MTFSDLTWDDLEAWAGTRVVKRGKSYKGCVSDLCRTADGRLLAWVRGGNRYATEVRLSEGYRRALGDRKSMPKLLHRKQVSPVQRHSGPALESMFR
jgi:hypothetical protein